VSSWLRPVPHPDPHVDAIRGYVTLVGDVLQASGTHLSKIWLDPSEPRDATFLFGTRAMVWNETHGFFVGEFVLGAPGVRTVLRDPLALGGGVLPAPASVPGLLARGGADAPFPLRSYDDGRDGFDAKLRGFASV
jgi:hypothetical protein